MKKTLLSLAVAAGMAASGASLAESTLYGNVHVSYNDLDNSPSAPTLESNTSSIGVKGKEDLGDGWKALYKLEFQVDVDDRNQDGDGAQILDRDQWVGLKSGGMGSIKVGTFTSNYKQMGGKVDPMYRTPLEGRGMLDMQSNLHSGAGDTGRGRMTNAIQYVSPKMGGIQVVYNNTITDGAAAETVGLGVRYSTKNVLVYLDYLDPSAAGSASADESATKIGGKFKAGPVAIGAQLEQTEDQLGSDYIFLSANYKIDKTNSVALTIGQRDAVAANSDSDAFAVMYNHKMSKLTNVYAGYGDYSHDVSTNDNDGFVLGIRKKF